MLSILPPGPVPGWNIVLRVLCHSKVSGTRSSSSLRDCKINQRRINTRDIDSMGNRLATGS